MYMWMLTELLIFQWYNPYISKSLQQAPWNSVEKEEIFVLLKVSIIYSDEIENYVYGFFSENMFQINKFGGKNTDNEKYFRHRNEIQVLYFIWNNTVYFGILIK